MHIVKKPLKDAITGHWWLAVIKILNDLKNDLKPLYASFRGIKNKNKAVSQ
jgi:hypothetical protein